MVSDEELRDALQKLFKMNLGFHVGFSLDLITIGQFENLTYWVTSLDGQGKLLWETETDSLEEAVDHFLRIRNERQLGFDFERNDV